MQPRGLRVRRVRNALRRALGRCGAAKRCFPGKGAQLSQLWRAKQLEYTWQRSLMQRYVPFSTVTREALAYTCEALELELSVAQMEGLMAEYLKLAPVPGRPPTLATAAQARRRSCPTARPTC